MVIKQEIDSFDEFKAWSGGKDTLDDLTDEQQKRLFQYAEEIFPEGCTDSELNDWLWFERDNIYEYLGLDKNGMEIGSTEWARPILMGLAESRGFTTCQFGNIYNIITCFLDEEYDESCDSEDELEEVFDEYVFEIWKKFAIQQLKAWHSNMDVDFIEEWIEKNYDKDELPDIDDVEESFSEYVEAFDELEED